MVFAEGGPLRISTSEAGGGLSPEHSVDGHQPILAVSRIWYHVTLELKPARFMLQKTCVILCFRTFRVGLFAVCCTSTDSHYKYRLPMKRGRRDKRPSLLA